MTKRPLGAPDRGHAVHLSAAVQPERLQAASLQPTRATKWTQAAMLPTQAQCMTTDNASHMPRH
eukprot:5448525-Amphidinium_carterae.1